MFNIAICDDEKSITAQLEDILLDFGKKHSIQSNIEVFYTGEALKEYGFLYIHQSYIVNYNHIISSEYNQVTMSNDTILPISQSRRKIIREQQLNLVRKGI